MHDIDRTTLEFGQEMGGFPGQEFELQEFGGGGSLSEQQEIQFAHELLSVNNEQELEQFLGDFLSKAVSTVSNIARSPIGQAIGGVLKGVASKALPMAGTALGGFIGGPLGAKIGGGLANAASQALGLEYGEMQESGELRVRGRTPVRAPGRRYGTQRGRRGPVGGRSAQGRAVGGRGGREPTRPGAAQRCRRGRFDRVDAPPAATAAAAGRRRRRPVIPAAGCVAAGTSCCSGSRRRHAHQPRRREPSGPGGSRSAHAARPAAAVRAGGADGPGGGAVSQRAVGDRTDAVPGTAGTAAGCCTSYLAWLAGPGRVGRPARRSGASPC